MGDYRANTNKILEKMSMAHGGGGAAAASTTHNGEGFKSAFSSQSSPVKRPFDVMSRLASPPPGPPGQGSSDTPTSSSPTAKKFKSGFTFGSSFGSPPPPGA